MKIRLIATFVFGLALTAAVCAQDQNPAPPDNQNSGMESGGGMGRGGRGGMGGAMGMMGRGVAGTVTEAAADHFTVKSFMSDAPYTIHFSANTRMFKQPAGGRGMGGGQWRRREGGDSGEGGGNPPQQIKPSDIKVGDSISAMGDVDASAKSVGAVAIVLLDPARAKELAQMEADYGKTWLMGRVSAVDGTKVTLTGGPDDVAHSFVANENTDFRKRRDPIALTDIQTGDMVRVEGALKDGVFTATAVNDMGTPGEARMRRNNPQQQGPQQQGSQPQGDQQQ